MNLIRLLVDRDSFIENLHIDDVKQIMLGTHASINITSSRHGNTVLNNGKIIKCFVRYYRPVDAKDFSKPKSSNACYYCTKEAGITNGRGGIYSCQICHLGCLDKLSNNEIRPKY